MKRVIIVIILLLVLGGCENHILIGESMKTKDFQISNNYYINYKYGFELIIPTNWRFGIENKREYSGYIVWVTFNKKIKGKFEKVGALSFYFLDQRGNEKENSLFSNEVKSLQEDIELGRREIERYGREGLSGSLHVLDVIDRISFFRTTNIHKSYLWFYTENTYKDIFFRRGKIVSEKRKKGYLYSYYIPFTEKNSLVYYLPLEIGFNEYEKYDFNEEERKNYMQEQREVILSFKTFSNFLEDRLPSPLEF
ncbi:MAG: hypothetical protein HPY78_10595 [Brevinematales bacterium]|nr:hypothetical protein [Brevinematales bacterium]